MFNCCGKYTDHFCGYKNEKGNFKNNNSFKNDLFFYFLRFSFQIQASARICRE